jgi:hypothetical protein
MTEYDKTFFDASKTLARYESEREQASGYNRYMMGRRISEYRRFVELQAESIHSLAAVIVSGNDGPKVICNCGLAVPSSSEVIDDAIARERLAATGHWDHTSNELAQIYVLHGHVVCAGCDLSQPIGEDYPETDWDKLDADHADCGFER